MSPFLSQVYPRVCGGTRPRPSDTRASRGLSPRVRGNPTTGTVSRSCSRSIPACAGEPVQVPLPTVVRRVYPRVCGGTCGGSFRAPSRSGLSPRVRGNRHDPAPPARRKRSIPACAGEPLPSRSPGRPFPVYPRVCGGTVPIARKNMQAVGLSPRVRGNLLFGPAHVVFFRSIPACAGEPIEWQIILGLELVYPRVCGGTCKAANQHRHGVGLSPRVRGNPAVYGPVCTVVWSIPACAGEPSWSTAAFIPSQVYPRVCGGTCVMATGETTGDGLSPRVRGNRGRNLTGEQIKGSIPACAGEPRPAATANTWRPVYPRVCGGTENVDADSAQELGLSPRVRGNPVRPRCTARTSKSIPACAGEPGEQGQRAGAARVYPRVCGGTDAQPPLRRPHQGLSPRVRGNPAQTGRQAEKERSIPACAGEPAAAVQ